MKKHPDKSIVVEHLFKNYEVTERGKGLTGSLRSLFSPKKKTVKALSDISFHIAKGELVGFIGPNGAGKTTTLKILSGLLYPMKGHVDVLGFDPWKRNQKFLKQISLVMGQKNQLWWDLPAIDSFELNRVIYEIPQKEYSATLDELVNMLEIEDLLGIQVRRLSLGQRMRMELAASLLHQPKVLFLDEPTIGLDLVAQQKVRDFIFDYRRRFEATIILTSHNMDDLVDLTKRVIVIDKGSLLFDGDFRELTSQFAKEKRINIFLSKEADLKKFTEIGKVERADFPRVTIAVPREVAAVAAAEILQQFPIADLTIEEEPVDSIIRRVFKGEK